MQHGGDAHKETNGFPKPRSSLGEVGNGVVMTVPREVISGMKKLMMALVTGAVLAMGGAATADCLSCGKYDVKLTVNGNPFYGKWAIVNDRPYVGIEAFSDYVGVPRSHYYKGWSFAKTPSETIEPLEHLVTAEGKKVDTIRFAGVTMIDLYRAAEALNIPVHHDFGRKIIQVGSGYTGETTKGKVYRHLSRQRGWTSQDALSRFHRIDRFEWEPGRGRNTLRRI